ncbi:phosphatidylinositol 3,4,5-trisphosphate 3-phosphatase TPTE2-like [Rhopilema esculentum]|uniref:phosphatidylinositol 3,4,5-trisphosphate 3-phosphatase TPTE2-like n=1 Tax=Rhopilema esculentum TaxID=499914 RepID=UPI0031CFA103
MSLVISYQKYEMFNDEEQLIYEDDDDIEGWEDDNEAGPESKNDAAPSSTVAERVAVKDALDNDYFLDRTLTSLSTPDNRIWDLGTPLGKARFKLHLVMDHIATRLFSVLLVLIDVVCVLVVLATNNESLGLQIVSLVIVSYFVVELLLRFFSWGFELFKLWVEIADMIIIVIALIATIVNEVILTDEKNQPHARYASLIVILRLLRIFLLARLFTGRKHLEKSSKYLVSQNKRRYQKDGYDLDLTYITERVIAMSFPSSGKTSVYRNPISEVSRFFNEKHPGQYKVYNLCSERSYETHYFNDNVERILVDDHNVPKLSKLLEFCHNAKNWMSADKDHVIAVHCKGGKGRTGTCISSWLLYSDQFSTAEKSLHYFGYRRTDRAKGSRFQGVETPSQSRYVGYIERVLKDHNGIVPAARPLAFVSIKVKGIKGFGNGDGSDLKMEIIIDGNVVFTFVFNAPMDAKITHKHDKGSSVKATFNEHACPVLSGDVKVAFHSSSPNVPKGYDNCAFFFWFHTSFIKNHKLHLTRNYLDNPHKSKVWKIYRDNFAVTLKFADPPSH